MKANQITKDNLIFITGATGTTGSRLVHELKGKARLRVGVRSPQRIAEFEQQSIETIPFDYNDTAGMYRAFQGVHTLFLLTANTETFDRQVNAVLQEAKDAGVQHVVRQSGMGINSEPGNAVMMMHRKAEQDVKSMGMKWTIIKPNAFMENILIHYGQTIRSKGAFYGAARQGKVSFIAASDIASCTAEILMNPDAHHGRTYRLTGPEALTKYQTAEILSRLFERKIKYIDISAEKLARKLRFCGIPAWLAQTVATFETLAAEGFLEIVTNDVARIIGRPAEHFESFLNRAFLESNLLPGFR